MRVKVLIRHYRDGTRLAAGEIVEMPDLEALDLISMGYVAKLPKVSPGRPPKTPPNTDFEGGGNDRMIRTKGA